MATQDRLLTPQFVLVVAVGLLYFLSIGALLPVVPVYVEDGLGRGSVAVGVAVGAFSVGAVLLRPLAGRVGDRAGRRVLVIFGALFAGLATSLYHFASSVPALVGARFAAGLGEAAFFVGAAAMATDLAPEERRGEAISYWSIAVYGGLGFGPFLGETLLAGDHYDRVWTLSALLALTAGVAALATRETIDEVHRTAPGTRPPLLHRKSIVPGMILFLGLIGLAGFVEFVPLYVDDIGLGQSRFVFVVYSTLVLGVRILGARIPDRAGPRLAGTGATSGVMLGMFVFAAAANPAGLYGGTVVFAMGMSLMYPAMLMLALTDVPARERGAAVGTVSSFFDLSQGLGAIILGLVAALAGIRGAFVAGGLFALAALVLLRSGADPRLRRAPDHVAAELARENLEPDPQ